MPILIRFAPYVLLVATISYFYFSYTSMKKEIKLLEENNITLKQNLQNEIQQFEKKLKAKEVTVKWKTKKIYIEKQIKKDTDEEAKSNNKPTNRFYLD